MKSLAQAGGSAELIGEFQARADAVLSWVERQGYRGYDPGDGLTSWLRPFTFDSLYSERLLIQLIWKSPINLRPLLGVRPLESTKGRGFMAWGHLKQYQRTGFDRYRRMAIESLEWLHQSSEPGYCGHCWGNHFDFTTRSGRMSAHTPTIVWSGLIGQVFIDAYEILHKNRYLEVADSICRWIVSLPKEETPSGNCLSYTGVAQSSIHNSNLLGAALLARTWRHTRQARYLEVARSSITYSCSRQRPDGAWWYGEAPKYKWIDNFHTGYNLDSLRRYIEATGDTEYQRQLESGTDYFIRTFFESTGRPRYYHDRTYPVDIQCAAQAIDTLCLCVGAHPEALSLAVRVAQWTVTNMQGRKGNFYYRRYPLIAARTPYFHWGQATMYKALSHLQIKLAEKTEYEDTNHPSR